MNAKDVCRCAGLSACSASIAAAGDKPPLRLVENAIRATPVSVARVRYEDGRVVRTSEWMPYDGGQNYRDPNSVRVFDCFGDSDGDGFMDDGGGCGLGASRWFFGTGYCNGVFTNDMVLEGADLSAGLGRLDLAWYWSCGGLPVEECIIAVFTQDSSPADNCEPDSFDYSGWLLNYGSLTCNPGGYYYSNVDLYAAYRGTWPAPTDGDGSYIMFYLTDHADALATCAQPMLWGASNNAGADPNNPGTQETEQFDDDAPLNGTHTLPTECYTYGGPCPDPLGGMAQFWGQGAPPQCDNADCDDNGIIDTRDFTCFFNLWVPKDSRADCDDNGIVDTRDFTCFFNEWNVCR